MAALEGQRPALRDAVVESALAVLRANLARHGETGRALALLGLARRHPSTPRQK